MWRTINCRACGNEIDATVSYCRYCGTPLSYRVEKGPGWTTILGVALIVMTILTAVLGAALVAAMNYDPCLDRDHDIQALEDENSEWWYIYRLRTGEYPYDLVTPDDPTIISKSSEILDANADGDLTWNDMYSINNWVFYNIAYSHDPTITNPDNYGERDYWQTPGETLNRGEGDCDDQANLALSLMLAEESADWLYGARVVFGGAGGHVGIFVDVDGDQMYVLDPTWGWASTNIHSEPLALDEWAERGGHDGVTTVREVYWETGSEKFDSLQDFYDWF